MGLVAYAQAARNAGPFVSCLGMRAPKRDICIIVLIRYRHAVDGGVVWHPVMISVVVAIDVYERTFNGFKK